MTHQEFVDACEAAVTDTGVSVFAQVRSHRFNGQRFVEYRASAVQGAVLFVVEGITPEECARKFAAVSAEHFEGGEAEPPALTGELVTA